MSLAFPELQTPPRRVGERPKPPRIVLPRASDVRRPAAEASPAAVETSPSAVPSPSRRVDYAQLAKPRIVVMITASTLMAGWIVAQNSIGVAGWLANGDRHRVGRGDVRAGGNQIWERRTDALMKRTAGRAAAPAAGCRASKPAGSPPRPVWPDRDDAGEPGLAIGRRRGGDLAGLRRSLHAAQTAHRVEHDRRRDRRGDAGFHRHDRDRWGF